LSINYFDEIKNRLTSAPDIIGKNKYLNTAVLIPLIEKGNEIHILFEKRSAAIRQGGEVSFPGGQFDPVLDNYFEQTAIRETCEELGLEADKVNIINKFGTLVAPMGLTIDVYVGHLLIKSLSEINCETTEVEKVFTLPLNYFLENEPEIFYSRLEIHTLDKDELGNEIKLLPVDELGLPEFYSRPWRNGKYRVLVYKTTPDIIWGLTAEIIYEFCNLLKGSK
jgi:peroxisomal coenzyme A diphosphatase NUDT7